MKTLTGIVRGRTIELAEAPGIAEGAEVELVVVHTSVDLAPGAGLEATEGALADDVDWDHIMDEIHRSRHWERSVGNGVQ